jgi:hypothetical protein
MNQDDAWRAVARECPRRIIPALHQTGEYAHGTIPETPGKVLCVQVSSTRPPGWIPTPAQEQAEKTAALNTAVPHK